MNCIRCALMFLLLCSGLTAWAQGTTESSPYRLVFTAVDAGEVFQVVGLKLGANVVYSVSDPVSVTINITVGSAEEAIKSVSAAAGLAYRKVGSTYVIAKPDGLRRALEPYGYRTTYTLKSMSASEVVKYLEEAIPTLTLRPAGGVVVAIGLPEDLALAGILLKNQEGTGAAPDRAGSVVQLEHASAQEVASVIATIYPEVKTATVGGKEAAGGSLGLSGPKGQVELAAQLAKSLDIPKKQVEVDLDFRVYEVRYSSAPVLKELVETAVPEVTAIVGPEPYSPMQPSFRPIGGSISGQSGSGSVGGAGGGQAALGATGGGGAGVGAASTGSGSAQPYQKVKEGDRAKTLVLRGPAWAVASAFALMQDLDRKPIQVKVQVHVVDSSPENDSDRGFKHTWSTFPLYEVPPGTTVESAKDTTRPAGFGQFSRVPWSLEALFNAITTQKDSKLLANPSIQVIDNDDATIFIGDTIRARIAQAGGLGAQTIEIREFPVGIILLLRPRVNHDGNITMRVHPVVSTLTAVDSDNIPQTSSREAETTIMMKDGETVVIGGLIRDEYSRTVQEIPVLSQIPILGELFRNRSTRSRKSEILVYITTSIVKDEEPPSAGPGGH